MKKELFTLQALAEQYREIETQSSSALLNELADIYTLATIKQLLGKQYTPYLDELRRTYAQNKRAEKIAPISEQIADLLEDRAEDRAELRALKKDLEDITLTNEEREELTEEYFKIKKNIAQYTEDLKTLRQVSVESYSYLKDLAQQFALCYLEHEPSAEELEELTDRTLGTDEDEPTKRQAENREQWEDLQEQEQEQALLHLAKIKEGKRAVNRQIRAEGKGSANYDKKVVSFDALQEQGARVKYAHTFNAYCQSLHDISLIRSLCKLHHLTHKESKALEMFCSKGAIYAGQKARTEYHAKQWDKAVKSRKWRDFYKRIDNAEYMARRKYACEHPLVNITGANRQSELWKKIEKKLAPAWRKYLDQVKELESQATDRKKVTKKREKMGAADRKIVTKREKLRIDLNHRPQNHAPIIHWIDKAQAEELHREQAEQLTNWSIAEPIAEPNTPKHETDFLPMHRDNISALSDKERDKAQERRQERAELLQAMENYNPPTKPTAPTSEQGTVKTITYFDRYNTGRRKDK